MEFPKEKEIKDTSGIKRKWTLVKVYEEYALYKCGQIRECFRPFDLDMIPKKIIRHRGGSEGVYWKVGNNKTMREYMKNLTEDDLI